MVSVLALLFVAANAAEYAGADVCARCHPTESEAQARSGHARAIAHSKTPQPGDWAFGAGNQAITFVKRLDAEHYLEEGRSWYRRSNAYGRTPGASTDAGRKYRILDPEAGILRCFACHSTGPLAQAGDGAIAIHEPGVRCEACHGPAAAHAQDPTHNRPFQPGRLGADQLNNFCGQCHRMPAGADDTPDLRNPWNARHQPLLLSASKCFLASKGNLSCLTCHPPHEPLIADSGAYDAKCSSCHAAPKHTARVAGKPCAGCHMPQVKPERDLQFANHRIGIFAPGDPLTPIAKPNGRAEVR